MKTAYEIAWELMEDRGINYISSVTGIPLEEIKILGLKHYIATSIEEFKKDINLVREVLDEIEQGKPHWEIGRNNVDEIDTSV